MYRWRIQSAKNSTIKRLDIIRKKLSNVLDIMRRHHIKEILSKLEKLNKDKRKKIVLLRVLTAFTERSKLDVLKQVTDNWVRLKNESKEMRNKLRRLFLDSIGNGRNNKFFLRTIKHIKETLDQICKSKHENVVKIQTTLRSKRAKKEKEMIKFKHDKFLNLLKKSFTKSSLNNKQYFHKWFQKSFVMKYHYSASIIQKFIKIKRKLKDQKISNVDLITKAMIKRMKNRFMKKLMNKVFRKAVNEFLKKYLFHLPSSSHLNILTKQIRETERRLIKIL